VVQQLVSQQQHLIQQWVALIILEFHDKQLLAIQLLRQGDLRFFVEVLVELRKRVVGLSLSLLVIFLVLRQVRLTSRPQEQHLQVEE
jgi:hypothetical protein